MTDNITYETVAGLASQYPFTPTIHVSDTMIEQFRFPRTKKRRIRNKWSKRIENWRPMRRALFDKDRNVIYMHPDMAEQMKSPPCTASFSYDDLSCP